MRQAGLMEVILQLLMVLFHEKSASIGHLVAVSGLKISVFETAVVFLCTSCLQHDTAVCGTVVTADKVMSVFCKSISLIAQLAIYFIWKAFSFTNQNYNKGFGLPEQRTTMKRRDAWSLSNPGTIFFLFEARTKPL